MDKKAWFRSQRWFRHGLTVLAAEQLLQRITRLLRKGSGEEQRTKSAVGSVALARREILCESGVFRQTWIGGYRMEGRSHFLRSGVLDVR